MFCCVILLAIRSYAFSRGLSKESGSCDRWCWCLSCMICRSLNMKRERQSCSGRVLLRVPISHIRQFSQGYQWQVMMAAGWLPDTNEEGEDRSATDKLLHLLQLQVSVEATQTCRQTWRNNVTHERMVFDAISCGGLLALEWLFRCVWTIERRDMWE